MTLKRFVLACVILAFAASGLSAYGDGFFRRIRLGSAGQTVIRTGTGSPNSAVSGSVGDIFLRTNGSTSTTLYVKESGSATTTGWTAAGGGGITGSVIAFPTFIGGGKCDNATASSPAWSLPPSSPAVSACATGSNTKIGVLDYADGSTLSAQTVLRMPTDVSGLIDFNVLWYATQTTGDVWWTINVACVTDTTMTVDQAFNQWAAGAYTVSGTTNRVNTAPYTGITNLCAAGDTWVVQLQREGGRGSDTMTGTAHLVGLNIIVRRTM